MRAAALVCCGALLVLPGCSTIATELEKKAARQVISSITTPLYVDPPSKPGCPMPAGGHAVTVTVADPAGPRVVLSIPNGWTAQEPVTAGTAAGLTGPEGITATVRLIPTENDADTALAAHLDELKTSLEGGTVKQQPSTLCGFAGRRIDGSNANQVVAERIAYVPGAGGGGYLAAVHIQGPAGAVAIGPAKAALLNNVVINV